MSDNLKLKTISSILWNTIDKVFSQFCYAVTGIVLANLLIPEDFGLIGLLTVFSAFATVFIDSGFGNALVQKKIVSQKDYSTIFLFNFSLSILLYIFLFFSAPFIAEFYEDQRIVVLSRVLFLNFIFISIGLVQSTILIREMKMKKLSIVNAISLLFSAIIALYLAFSGYGVWSLVGQHLSYSGSRSLILWFTTKWKITLSFSKRSLHDLYNFGFYMFLTSFINTFFQNIYTFIIGKYDMKDLGYYTQADKWSKMGITAVSHSVGFSLFPTLASIQDDKERMRRVFSKVNKMTSYVTFPVFIGLIVVAEPLFHSLFGSKWDPSIFLFQLLLIRGIFFIYTSILNNYIMAIGNSRIIFRLEIIKDIILIVAIIATIRISIPALVIGQVISGGLHYVITAYYTSKYTGYTVRKQIMDMLPYIFITILMAALLILTGTFIINDYVLLSVQVLVGALFYFILNNILNSNIQQELIRMILRKGSPEK